MFVLSIIGLLALIVLITCLCETDNGGWGLFSIICAALICEFWLFKGTASVVWSYIAANPGIIIAGLLFYIVFGVLWSIAKWKIHVVDWSKGNSGRVADVAKRKLEGREVTIDLPIDPGYNKSKIITWMGYWPFSLGWFIIHKPFTRLYNWLFNILSNTYQRISNSVYKKITN